MPYDVLVKYDNPNQNACVEYNLTKITYGCLFGSYELWNAPYKCPNWLPTQINASLICSGDLA